MSEFMKKHFEKQIALTGSLSAEEAKQKWKDNETLSEKIIGKPFYEYSSRVNTRGEEEFTMNYHMSYKKDFCDTMFSGEIFNDDDTCQLHGYIKATPLMKRFALIFLICCVVLGGLYLVFAPFGYPLYGFLIFIVLGITVAFLSLKVDNGRINRVMEALQEFIN